MSRYVLLTFEIMATNIPGNTVSFMPVKFVTDRFDLTATDADIQVWSQERAKMFRNRDGFNIEYIGFTDITEAQYETFQVLGSSIK